MRILSFLNGINGVVPGGVATLDIPVGRRYHAIKVWLAATVGGLPSTDPTAIISSARLLVNGVVLRDLLPADVINIAKLNLITPDATTGELPFFFSEPWRASVLGEEATSWDMNPNTGALKFTLELSFIAGIVSPSAVVEASYDYGRNTDNAGKQFLSIVKQLRYTKSNPTGTVDLTDLPQQYPIQRIHLRVSAGTISSVEVWNDTTKVWEGNTANLNDFLKDYEMDGTHFALSTVFDYTQQISDALFVQNNNLNVRPTCSAAGAITAIVEHRAPGYV